MAGGHKAGRGHEFDAGMYLKPPAPYDSFAGYCTALCEFLGEWNWLIQSNSADFLSLEVWRRVPAGWLSRLGACSADELLRLARDGTIPSQLLAPSDDIATALVSFLKRAIALRLNTVPTAGATAAAAAAVATAGAVPVSILRLMTPKKQHEVSAMAPFVCDLCCKLAASRVVDIGSGAGQLGRGVAALTHERNRTNPAPAGAATAIAGDAKAAGTDSTRRACACELTVVGIDSQSSNTATAAKWAKRETESRSITGAECGARFVPLTQVVDRSFGTAHNAVNAIFERAGTGAGATATASATATAAGGAGVSSAAAAAAAPALLVGLHACGDLTSTLLRAFIASPEFGAVVSVGCCYNLLSEPNTTAPAAGGSDVKANSAVATEFGFPLSDCVRRSGFGVRFALSRHGKRLACEPVHKWLAPSLFSITDSWRAVLFVLIQRLTALTATPAIATAATGSNDTKSATAAISHALPGHDRPVTVGCPKIGKSHASADDSSASSFAEFAIATLRRMNLLTPPPLPAALPAASATRAAPRSRVPPLLELCLNRAFEAYQSDGKIAAAATAAAVDSKLSEPPPLPASLNAFIALRALFAPLLEQLIAVDRLLFIAEYFQRQTTVSATVSAGPRENGSFVGLLPLFHPTISPRNIALVAIKPFHFANP